MKCDRCGKLNKTEDRVDCETLGNGRVSYCKKKCYDEAVENAPSIDIDDQVREAHEYYKLRGKEGYTPPEDLPEVMSYDFPIESITNKEEEEDEYDTGAEIPYFADED